MEEKSLAADGCGNTETLLTRRHSAVPRGRQELRSLAASAPHDMSRRRLHSPSQRGAGGAALRTAHASPSSRGPPVCRGQGRAPGSCQSPPEACAPLSRPSSWAPACFPPVVHLEELVDDGEDVRQGKVSANRLRHQGDMAAQLGMEPQP
eukprot:scaffold1014_cov260-Pinguiococcus_pyrenoidosus.AAC.18